MSNVIQYKSSAANTDVGNSPAIWGDCPWAEIQNQVAQGRGGLAFFEDFTYVSVVDGDVLQMLGDNAPVRVVDTLNGRLAITSGATDNDQSICAGEVDLVHISDADGEKQKLWFEARVKVSSIADMGLFVGLAAESVVAVDFLADNSADLVATAACIGFHVLTATPTAVGTSYQAASQTKQAVQTGVHTLVADTYVKLGMIYNPNATDAEKVTFFVNGVPQTSFVTATNIAAATFPDSVNMTFMMTTITGEAVTKTLPPDWIRIAQLPV